MKQYFKCVCVGDGAVGKTSLFMEFSSPGSSKDAEYIPSVFDVYNHNQTVFGVNLLTKENLDEFKATGMYKSSTFFTDEEKKNIIQWTEEIQSWKETTGKHMIYYEKKNDEKLLCRIENFVPFHSELAKLFLNKLNDAVSFFLEEEAILFKDKLNLKLPNGRYLPHQDAPGFQHLAKKKQLSVMIAVDEATQLSGCLDFVPGENKVLLDNIAGVLKEDIVKKWDDEKKWIPTPAQPGDVIFFDNLIPHRSGPNNSKNPRRNYYLTYNVASEGDLRDEYYKGKRENFPPEFERKKDVDYSNGKVIYNVANPIE
eukprot:gene12196-5783_t